MYLNKELINGIQVARCVTVYTDLTWMVTVHGTTIDNTVFTSTNSRPPTKLDQTSDLDTLLNMVGMNSKLCPGCNNPEFNETSKSCLDKKGNLSGTVETMSNSNSQTFQTRRSTSCQYLISANNHKVIRCQSCSQLNKILSNSLYKHTCKPENQNKEQSKPGCSSESTTNWRFLSDTDKFERYVDQKRRRINTERRERYVKKKLEEEEKLILLTNEDTDDLKIMFIELDDSMTVPENYDESASLDDDSFFWSMQREVIQSGKMVKWHPR